MAAWVAVVHDEHEDPVEVQTEPDGTLLLTTVTAQFPGTTGLKFRNPETNGLRGVRCHDNVLYPPDGEKGWGATTYICVRPPSEAVKRKASAGASDAYDADVGGGKMARKETADLIVLGLPFTTSEETIKNYFESFGSLMMIQLKKNPNGQSKGYGFIRFNDVESQDKVLLTRHFIDDRWCDVKVPESQDKIKVGRDMPSKIFVARITESITPDDLREHFEQFGTVTDVFVPTKPFRSFAFVTFVESKVAQSLLGKDHIIKGVSVHIGLAAPRVKGGANPSSGPDPWRQSAPGSGAMAYGNYTSGGSSPWSSAGGAGHMFARNGGGGGQPRGYYQ